MIIQRKVLSTVVVVLAIAAGACGSSEPSTPDPRLDPGATDSDQPVNRLRQVVTLNPASPIGGTNVAVRSVLINTSSAALNLTSRICGLDYEGTLALTHPPEVMKCAGVSASAPLAPGDSIVVEDLMRVANPAGSFELRVRHALSPALAPSPWTSVPVAVRAP